METTVTESNRISPEEPVPAHKNKFAMPLIVGISVLLVVLSGIVYMLYETGNLNDRYILEWKDVLAPTVRVESTEAGEELVIDSLSVFHSGMTIKNTKTTASGDSIHVQMSLRMHLPFEQRCDGVHMMCDMDIFHTSRIPLTAETNRVLFGNEETLIWERGVTLPVSGIQEGVSDSNARSQAIEIAEREVQKNFPDMKREGVSLIMEGAKQWSDNPSRWTVTYGAPLTLDAQVVVTVDVVTGEVVEYQDSWS